MRVVVVTGLADASEVPVAERAAWEGELTDELWGEI